MPPAWPSAERGGATKTDKVHVWRPHLQTYAPQQRLVACSGPSTTASQAVQHRGTTKRSRGKGNNKNCAKMRPLTRPARPRRPPGGPTRAAPPARRGSRETPGSPASAAGGCCCGRDGVGGHRGRLGRATPWRLRPRSPRARARETRVRRRRGCRRRAGAVAAGQRLPQQAGSWRRHGCCHFLGECCWRLLLDRLRHPVAASHAKLQQSQRWSRGWCWHRDVVAPG